MKNDDRENFHEWYKTTEGKAFDFQQVMYRYCKNDVDILRRVCMKLRELFIQIANIDLFQYITIASVSRNISK